MDKKDIVKEIVIIFWLFIIGSILGYIFEMIVVLFQKGYFESRQGLIYGPFTPVYGIGIVVYYCLLKNINTKNKAKIMLLTAVLGGIVEYLCSLVQEKVFGTISWDYSHLMFDINGRTSLLHCTYWGIAGVLYVTYIEPLLEKLKQVTDKKMFRNFTTVFMVFMIINICISYVAADRQTKRRMHIEPENEFDMFLDKYYPDEYMDKIFTNKKEVIK